MTAHWLESDGGAGAGAAVAPDVTLPLIVHEVGVALVVVVGPAGAGVAELAGACAVDGAAENWIVNSDRATE